MEAIIWKSETLQLLDQRLLPHQTIFNSYSNEIEVAAAIKDMVVRGAPAIGVTAMYGLVLALKQEPTLLRFQSACETLMASRPTAVNLGDAIRHLQAKLQDWDWQQNPAAFAEEMAKTYHAEDTAMNHTLGKLGADYLKGTRRVLTHCNTGFLATSGFGTALGIVRQLHQEGRLECVYADETRPFLQGARLTAWECEQDGLPYKVVTDGMGGYLMSQGLVDCVIVGSDRIAANGDVANKIGTFMLAMAAKYHQIPFVVAAPSTTVDAQTASGKDIPIEQRPIEEVTHVLGQRIVPEGAQVANPAFDVTPAELVTAIVTEQGVFHYPYDFS